jgi:hypothetical protein
MNEKCSRSHMILTIVIKSIIDICVRIIYINGKNIKKASQTTGHLQYRPPNVQKEIKYPLKLPKCNKNAIYFLIFL